MILHNHTITTGIVGVTGYSGIELLRILRRHPGVRVTELYARSAVGQTADQLAHVPGAGSGAVVMPLEEVAISAVDVLFLALPHSEAAKLVHSVPLSTRIVDLSGDFRLRDAAAYPSHYNFEHPSPALLADAVYGIPELNHAAIANARLLANPGCYPTATILALAPLASINALPTVVPVHALSGVSGAGRNPSATTHFVEVNESVSAYKIGGHQHTPEMEQAIADAGAPGTQVVFIPHLIPVSRGIHATISIPMSNKYAAGELTSIYRDFYTAAPFVRVLDAPPRMIDVAHTNRCDLFVHADTRTNTATIISVIDNLGKGAAGQAVQNMNIMTGMPETMGVA
jgi:N-acetyl-gamma-glutamyl-phosphate reductase